MYKRTKMAVENPNSNYNHCNLSTNIATTIKNIARMAKRKDQIWKHCTFWLQKGVWNNEMKLDKLNKSKQAYPKPNASINFYLFC